MSKGNKPANKKEVKALSHRVATAPLDVSQTVQVSNCAKDYGNSLMAPWGPAAPCLPMGFPLPSRKMKCFSRGTAGVGSSSALGYVLLAPGVMAANDANSVWYTTSAWTGSVLSATPTTGLLGVASNSDYASASFAADQAQYRLVSAGIRVKYRGTELNRGGSYCIMEHPDHQSLVGDSLSVLLAYDNCTRTRPPGDDEWISVVYSGPKNPSELEYAYDTGNISAHVGGTVANNPCMVIFLEGQADMTVDWECWANFEFIGSPVRGRTISHYDPVGAFSVSSALDAATSFASDLGRKFAASTPEDRGKNRHHKSFVGNVWAHARKFIADQSSKVVPFLKKEGLAMASQALKKSAPLLLEMI